MFGIFVEILNHMQSVWYMYVLGGVAIGAVSWLHATYRSVKKSYTSLQYLIKECQPNGGESIKDMLNKILHRIDSIEFMKLAQFNIMEVPIFIADVDGKYRWANKAYLLTVGMALEEVIGTGWSDNIHTEDKQRVLDEWYRACSEFRPFNSRYRIIVDGRIEFVFSQAVGKPDVGYFGVIYKSNKALQIQSLAHNGPD